MKLELIPHLVAVDASARERAATALPHVAKAFALSIDPRRGPSPNLPDPAYTWTVAVNVGLNHWIGSLPLATRFVPAKRGEAVEVITIQIEAGDAARATKLADRLGVPIASVFSAAACTGLHTLLGSRELAGPFADPEDPTAVVEAG